MKQRAVEADKIRRDIALQLIGHLNTPSAKTISSCMCIWEQIFRILQMKSVYERPCPDGAKRNPGYEHRDRAIPDCAALHPGYKASKITGGVPCTEKSLSSPAPRARSARWW